MQKHSFDLKSLLALSDEVLTAQGLIRHPEDKDSLLFIRLDLRPGIIFADRLFNKDEITMGRAWVVHGNSLVSSGIDVLPGHLFNPSHKAYSILIKDTHKQFFIETLKGVIDYIVKECNIDRILSRHEMLSFLYKSQKITASDIRRLPDNFDYF